MYYFFAFYFFVLGAIFGSFLSCLAWRLYREESVLPSSHCEFCGRQLPWYENVPLLSYLLLRGRCAGCRKKINWQYFATEALGAFLFFFAFFSFFEKSPFFSPLSISGHQWLLFAYQLFALLVLFFVLIYDGRYFLVSLPITLSSALIFFVFNIFLGVTWFAPLISAAIGASFFLVQYLLTKGRGIGEGDIYLGVLLGCIFPNYLLLIFAILLSYLIGAVSGLILVIFGKKGLKSSLPLGLFLALGAMITIFYGQQVINWYFALL